MRPLEDDIRAALEVEESVGAEEMDLYLECLNELPMSRRATDQELRDGCILTFHVFARVRSGPIGGGSRKRYQT